MMLIDSNIIIYGAKPEFQEIRELLSNPDCVVSIIGKVEVLGYQGMTSEETLLLEKFFNATPIIGLTDQIADFAISLRKARRMSLGDALIAATALIHGFTLVTRNTSDFNHLSELTVLNPFSK